MKEDKHLSFASENLAVPEVHLEDEQDDFDDDNCDKDMIDYDNKAIPEIRIRKK